MRHACGALGAIVSGLCSAAAATPAAAAAFLAADSPAVLWTGRTRPAPGRGVAFDWEGVSASFAVTGSGIWVGLVANVTLNPSCAGRISVFVNGFHTANMLLHADTTSYLLVAGLQQPAHNVTVAYTMEPGNSCASYGAGQDVAFTGFTTSGAFVETPPPQLSRRIDVVGDSITAGSQYDPEHPTPVICNDWLVTNSVTYNWESYLCRQFRANCTTIAWSGKGLINNGGCNPGPNMTTLYRQTEGGDAASLFDFSRASRPDALIVYLGTNGGYKQHRPASGRPLENHLHSPNPLPILHPLRLQLLADDGRDLHAGSRRLRERCHQRLRQEPGPGRRDYGLHRAGAHVADAAACRLRGRRGTAAGRGNARLSAQHDGRHA